MIITESWFRWYDSIAAQRYANLQRYNVRTVAEATVEPLTLEQCYWHLNIDTDGSPPGSDHDDWLENIGIPGARAWCEAYLELTIAQQTLELATDQFPSEDFIDLPFGPVLSIESVTYLDDGGNDVVFADTDYLLDNVSEPHRLYLGYEMEWPEVVRQVRNSVRIRYVVGYSLPDESPPGDFPLPSRIRIGMLLLLGHLFNNRENTTELKLEEIPIGVKSFLDWDSKRLGFA